VFGALLYIKLNKHIKHAVTQTKDGIAP